MHHQSETHRRSALLDGARALARVAAVLVLSAMIAAGAAAESVDRLIIAMEPPNADTNLYWATGSDVSLFPALSALVGNDVETGHYSNDGLAESWEANEDFTSWTFHLHPGAEWHYGWGPATAADVAHSYELHTGEDSTQTAVAQLRGAEIEIVDDHTIRFIFPEPRVNFLFAVASRGSMLMYSKAQYDAEGLEGYERRPAGTERYQLVERVGGQGVLFERVEGHWSGEDAHFPELEIRWTPEPATKLAMLLAGEAHISTLDRELQPDAIAGGMEVIASTHPSAHITTNFNGLYMRTGNPDGMPDLPWADIRVREAMNRALNRDEILEVIYRGRASKIAVYGMGPNNEGYLPELEERFEAEYGYDPERAKALLAEAGYPDAFPEPVIPIVLSQISGNPEVATLAELLQVYFEEIGLQTELREMDWATMNSLGRGRKAYVINPNRNAPVRPTEPFLMSWHTTEGSPNAGYEDDVTQELAHRLSRTVDLEERAAIGREAFTYLFEQYAEMPIAAIHAEMTVNPQVVKDWKFPGSTTAGMSHWHLIEPAE